MASAIETAATAVTAPGKVYVRNAVAVAEVLQLATADWDSNWITVQAETDDVFVKFGTTSASVSGINPAAVSGATTPVDPATGGCLHVPAGTQKEFYLRDWVKLTSQGIFMAHISSAVTTGKIRFYKSSGPREL